MPDQSEQVYYLFLETCPTIQAGSVSSHKQLSDDLLSRFVQRVMNERTPSEAITTEGSKARQILF